MPRQTPTKNNNKKDFIPWKGEGPDAVQLFRDIFFGKYPKGTKATEAYNDPDREYNKFSERGFPKQFHAFNRKVETFRALGQGVTDSFRKKLQLHIPPEGGTGFVENKIYEDDEDEEDQSFGTIDFSNNETLTLGGFDEESYNLKEDQDEEEEETVITVAKMKSARAKSTPKKQETSSGGALGWKVPLFGPLLTECHGGVLAAYTPIFSGVEYDFSISSDGKQVLQKMLIPEEFFLAKTIFARHELTDFNVYIAGVQDNINKMKQLVQTNESGQKYHEIVLFDLPFEIERTFFDEKGVKAHKVFEGRGKDKDVLWVFFYMKKIEPVAPIVKTPAKIEREQMPDLVRFQQQLQEEILKVNREKLKMAMEQEMLQEREKLRIQKLQEEQANIEASYQMRMREAQAELEAQFQAQLSVRYQEMEFLMTQKLHAFQQQQQEQLSPNSNAYHSTVGEIPASNNPPGSTMHLPTSVINTNSGSAFAHRREARAIATATETVRLLNVGAGGQTPRANPTVVLNDDQSSEAGSPMSNSTNSTLSD